MKRFGLLGKSLSHSFSQKYFTEKFRKEKIDAVYQNFEVEAPQAIRSLIAEYPDLVGLNVTIPYKESVIEHLDVVDPTALSVGAVNTVRILNGRTRGYNTDIIGFRESIRPYLTHGTERALILGTGGAAKAVKFVLSRMGIDCLFVSRTPAETRQISYDDLSERIIKSHKLIINTTPLGTWPDIEEKPDIPYRALEKSHLLYDLVYNPAVTAFMREGQKSGCTILNGLTMLQIQAEKSWEIWNSNA